MLATGGGSVEARETRNVSLSARGVVVYLETTIEKQLARTQRVIKRPLLRVEAHRLAREVLEALANERNPLYEEICRRHHSHRRQSAGLWQTRLFICWKLS